MFTRSPLSQHNQHQSRPSWKCHILANTELSVSRKYGIRSTERRTPSAPNLEGAQPRNYELYQTSRRVYKFQCGMELFSSSMSTI